MAREPLRKGETEGGGKRPLTAGGYSTGARMMGELGGSGDLASAKAAEPVLDADRAAWLKNDLREMAELAVVLSYMRRNAPSAFREMYESALQGAVQGLAREICGTFGYKPGENLEPYADRAHRKWVL